MSFNHQEIEKKWQQYWEDNKTFKTTEDKGKPKFLCTGYVSLSIRCRSSCRASGRVTLQQISFHV